MSERSSAERTTFRFRILVVEDVPQWIDIIKTFSRPLTDIAHVDYVGSREDALSALAKKHYHFVSLDQNLPPRKGDIVEEGLGISLCEELVRRHPITDRAIYTAYGRPRWAQRGGALDGTPYFEKKISNLPDALDVDEYVAVIVARLTAGYVSWALERLGQHLPPSLAQKAMTLRQAWLSVGHDRPRRIVEELKDLWERAMWLCWAQACALAGHKGNRDLIAVTAASDVGGYVFGTIQKVWAGLDPQLLFSWRKFIGNGDPDTDRGIGSAFLSAAQAIRDLVRNPASHGRLGTLDEQFIDELSPLLIRLLDALSFWAEVPLLIDPHYHPHDHNFIEAVRLSGIQLWPTTCIEAAYGVPPNPRPQRVYVPLIGSDSSFLLDLFPIVSMGRSAGGPLEPQILSPRVNGFRRTSLVTGLELVGSSLTTEERDAIRMMFSDKWQIKR